MKKLGEPTCVSLVYKVLVNSDDFKTIAQLVEETRCEEGCVMAATYHLHTHKAADLMVSKGVTYWFATSKTDNRMHEMVARKIEDKPRRLRKRAVH